MARRATAIVVALLILLANGGAWSEGVFAVGRANGYIWWGYSKDHQTHVQARLRALQACAQRGPNCSFVAKISGSCFALATTVIGNGFSWATRGTIIDASQVVLQQCARGTGVDCTVKLTFCDSINEDAEIARRDMERREFERAQIEETQRRVAQAAADRRAAELAAEEARQRAAMQQRRAADEAAEAARQRSLVEQAEEQRRAAEQARRIALAEAAEAERRSAEMSRARDLAEQRRIDDQNKRREQAEPPARLQVDPLAYLRKPVPEAYALAIFLFCAYVALKETIKSGVPGRYKFATVFAIAGFEVAMFYIVGAKLDDPKIIDVVLLNTPLIGVVGAVHLVPRFS